MILTRGKLETILAFERMKIHAEINELKEEIARLKEAIENDRKTD